MDEALWALGRGTGVVGLVLLSLSIVLGVTTRAGRPAAGLPRFGIARLHRDVALLATAFIAVHLVSLLFDSYAQLEVVDLLVPFLADYSPIWVGLGTLAVDIVIAVVATALLRHRIGPRVFRFVHWGAYLLWPLSVVHAVGAGSDATEPWLVTVVVICVAGVLAAIGWRLSRGFGAPAATAVSPADAAQVRADHRELVR